MILTIVIRSAIFLIVLLITGQVVLDVTHSNAILFVYAILFGMFTPSITPRRRVN